MADSINYTITTTQTGFDFSEPSKPAEIIVEEEDGEFKVFRIIEKMVPKKVKEEMKFEPFGGNDFGEFLEWMNKLSNDELEAAHQIYYDIWNFKSGDSDDKARFELIEGEQKRRKVKVQSNTGNGGGIILTAGAGGAEGAGGVVGGVVGICNGGGGSTGYFTSGK